jgi:hypothetical protein
VLGAEWLAICWEISRVMRVGELCYGCVVRGDLQSVAIVVVIPMNVQSLLARELPQ